MVTAPKFLLACLSLSVNLNRSVQSERVQEVSSLTNTRVAARVRVYRKCAGVQGFGEIAFCFHGLQTCELVRFLRPVSIGSLVSLRWDAEPVRLNTRRTASCPAVCSLKASEPATVCLPACVSVYCGPCKYSFCLHHSIN